MTGIYILRCRANLGNDRLESATTTILERLDSLQQELSSVKQATQEQRYIREFLTSPSPLRAWLTSSKKPGRVLPSLVYITILCL